MTTQLPSNAYREDVLWRAWWLYIILGVVWVWIVAGRRWLGGRKFGTVRDGWHFRVSSKKSLPRFHHRAASKPAKFPLRGPGTIAGALAPLPPPFGLTRSRAKVQAERGRPPSAIPNSFGQVGRARIVRYLHPVCCIWTVSLSLCCRARTGSDRPRQRTDITVTRRAIIVTNPLLAERKK